MGTRTLMSKLRDAVKLMDDTAKDTEPPPRDYVILNDTVVKGFGLLITRNGARSWVFRYRHNGRSRRYVIGSFPSWSATHARNRARELDRLVDEGRDPQGEKDAGRKAPTMAELCDRYLREYAARKRSRGGDERMISGIIKPALGT